MPARSKSAPKDSTATIGFEATAMRGSAILPRQATLRSLSEAKDNLWLAADSRSTAETAEGNRSNNMDAAEPSGANRVERDSLRKAARRAHAGACGKQPAAGSPKGQRGGAEQYSRAERDRLPQAAHRADAEASVNHVVLGLIFLSRAERDRSPKATRRASRGLRVKYISDTFEEHRAKLVQGNAGAPPAGSGALAASSSDNPYAGAYPEDPDEPSGARQPAAGNPKGERGGANQYKAENVFWVPADARWSHLQASAKLPTMGMSNCKVRMPNRSRSISTFETQSSKFA